MQIYLPIAEMPINAVLLLGIGLAVGVLSGMFGIGGGFIVTPLLIFLGVPAPIAVGTGAAQVAASSVSGTVTNWTRQSIDFKMVGILLAGGLGGSTLGVFMQRWLKAVGQLELFISAVYVILLGTIGVKNHGNTKRYPPRRFNRCRQCPLQQCKRRNGRNYQIRYAYF